MPGEPGPGPAPPEPGPPAVGGGGAEPAPGPAGAAGGRRERTKRTAAAIRARIPTIARSVPSGPRPPSSDAGVTPIAATGTVIPEIGLPAVITGTPVSFAKRLLPSTMPAFTT